jgi:hypothetical protein
VGQAVTDVNKQVEAKVPRTGIRTRPARGWRHSNNSPLSERAKHPHPRVTAVAKKATAAPLALSRKRARDFQKGVRQEQAIALCRN